MNYTEFINNILDLVSERVDSDITLSINKTLKNNNCEQIGIVFKKEKVNIAPTIYMEQFFSEYECGESVEKIVDSIITIYNENLIGYNVTFDSFTEYEKAKTNLYLKVINYNQNQGILKKAPHEKYLDLAMVVYYYVELEPFDNATVLVLNEHLKVWNKTSEEIIKDAYDNTLRNMACRAVPIFDILREGKLFGDFAESELLNDFPMKVVTNDKRFLGGVFIGIKERLDELYDEMNGDYYIIPSSIHELILIPQKEYENVSDLNVMIREVNANNVPPEEVLSDHAYLYRKGEEALIF